MVSRWKSRVFLLFFTIFIFLHLKKVFFLLIFDSIYNVSTSIDLEVHNCLFSEIELVTYPFKEECEQNKLDLLVLVKSAIHHFDQREVIRQTWARVQHHINSVAVVFLTGLSNVTSDNRKLNEEAQSSHDILLGNFVDDYLNLTLKSVMGLLWVSKYCSNVKLVISVDDDTFVDLKQAHKIYIEGKSISTSIFECGRKLHKHAKVKRRGKWSIPFDKYNISHYPPYCTGDCYMMSGDVTAKLYAAALGSLAYFTVDDAFISGVLREKIGIGLTKIEKRVCSYLDNSNENIQRNMVDAWQELT